MTQPATFSQAMRIIQYGMRNAFKLEEGQELNSEQLAEGINRLNDLCNFLQTQGLRLWTQSDTSITLVAAQAQYTLPGVGSGKPLRIPKDLSYKIYNTTGVKTPILTLSQQEWVLLSQNNVQGPVTQIYVDKQLSQLVVNTFLIPDSTEASSYTLHVVVQNQMTQYQKITDATQFPQEWYVGLQWLYAKEVCQGQSQEVVARCDQMAEYYRNQLNGWDVEDDATFIVPDSRLNMYGAQNFR